MQARAGSGAPRNTACVVTKHAAPPAVARERTYEELESIFAGVDAPFALVDLDAMWSNGQEMLARAQGTPIRVASKSVRCRPLLAQMLERAWPKRPARPGAQGTV